ncbi:hypothetical protein ES705_34883 [subsurface metagenome]
MLWLVFKGWHSFDKSPVAECHHDPLMGDKVFLTKLHHPLLTYLSSPWVAIFRFQFIHFFFYQEQYSLGVSQKVFQISNGFNHFSILIKDFAPLQISQPA